MAVLLAGGAAAVRGQSALDGFDPNANGTVRAVVVQPDGKILIGGDFTTLSPNGGPAVTRNHIARLNPDGRLDTTFDPNANNSVYSIAVQADGKILVGGVFSGANSIGGQTRNYIARLDATTGAADSFDPNANDVVYAIAVQADGKILAGGAFNGTNSIGGQTRNRIARLDATTGLADSFDPNANDVVYAIAVQADGKILAGGLFNGANSIGEQTRNYIARLDATTGLADSLNPNANNSVVSIAVQADGKILAGGLFNGTTSIGGQTRNYIARLDATTGAADSFDPNANNEVYSIAVQADGKILAGGNFTSIGGQTRNYIARLDGTMGLADSFDPNASGAVNSIAVQADGKILAGGGFTALAPNGGAAVTRNHIARLETNGRLDQTLDLDLSTANDYVLGTAVQPDGKILIGGSFHSVLGVTRNNIARLNTDGTLDTAFDPNANSDVYSIAVQADGKILAGGDFNGTNSIGGQLRNYIARLDSTTGLADSFDPNASSGVRSIAVQADGKILAGGFFTSIGGQTRNYIARLDSTTGLADSFDPNASDAVRSILVQADGKILAGGGFTSIGGQTRNHIVRLDATSGLADSFNPNANSNARSIAVQADGKILAGGGFTSIGGQTRNRIARLDSTTGLADSFDPNANSAVYSIAVQADGKILAGGDFTSIGGQTRNRIARLDPATGLADSFDPNANTNSILYSIAVQADGKVLAGGIFTSIGGQTRNHFARLSNDTAALQNLAVTQTTITWTLGGSSAQFTRVTFEYSTDNVSYAPLGNGTATGSNWTLTGLNLPTGQNFYIRARGYYRNGYQNGSESITESVRNAFTATFTSQYYLTMSAGTGGTVSPSSGWKNSGAAVSISATPATGYTFSGWTGSGTGSYSGTNNPASITMSGPITETAAFTQNPVQITVQTSPTGLSFTVDGTIYTAAQTFSWAPGSSHTIATTSPQNGAAGVRYAWSKWSDGGGISHTVAPATNKTYTATFATQYYLTMGAGTGGTVSPSSGWKNSGTTVSITATPTNNTQVSYNFSSWAGSGTDSYSGTNNPASITMSGPITETAAFNQNPVSVTVQTNPAGLTFTVDSTTYTAAQTFSWAAGSSHTIATTSPQSGAAGVRYVWSNWSGGGAISHTVAPTKNTTYTATFTTQYYLTMSAGSGGTVSPSSGWKNSGTNVSITATPTNNTLVSYTFSGWTGSGTGSYSGPSNPASITMSGPITEAAAFTQNPVNVTVQTTPAGLAFSVDGTNYTAAQTFSWAPGSSHTIATTSPQSGGTGIQYVWSNWSGGGAISHTVAPTKNTTYTATFTTQYYLTMSAGTGGSVSPSSGWKNGGAAVSISATPATGYTFSGWTGSGTGSYSGTDNPRSITMMGPITETATFTHN